MGAAESLYPGHGSFSWNVASIANQQNDHETENTAKSIKCLYCSIAYPCSDVKPLDLETNIAQTWSEKLQQ